MSWTESIREAPLRKITLRTGVRICIAGRDLTTLARDGRTECGVYARQPDSQFDSRGVEQE